MWWWRWWFCLFGFTSVSPSSIISRDEKNEKVADYVKENQFLRYIFAKEKLELSERLDLCKLKLVCLMSLMI